MVRAEGTFRVCHHYPAKLLFSDQVCRPTCEFHYLSSVILSPVNQSRPVSLNNNSSEVLECLSTHAFVWQWIAYYTEA